MNIKAILIGTLYVIVLGLVIQLAFMFLAMGYTELVRAYPLIAIPGRIISYLAGVVVYFILMASAGFLTASIAKNRIVLHGVVISAIPVCLSLFSSQDIDDLTILGPLFLISGILFAVTGAQMWKRKTLTAKQDA